MVRMSPILWSVRPAVYMYEDSTRGPLSLYILFLIFAGVVFQYFCDYY